MARSACQRLAVGFYSAASLGPDAFDVTTRPQSTGRGASGTYPPPARLLIFQCKAGQGRAGSTPPSAPLRGHSSPVLAMLAMLGPKEGLRVAVRGSGPPSAEVEPSRSPALPIAISNRADPS